ncbi:MAG: ABC-F family ATP-binding cassette domain-containing protein [Bacteroidales bacterium]
MGNILIYSDANLIKISFPFPSPKTPTFAPVMNYLSVENLSKAYGEKLLFEEVTFGIEEGQKVALLAKNGSGKTTLLNILAGLDIADSGKVSWHKEVQVAYLSQMPVFDPGLSVLDAILSSETAYVQAVKNYELVMQLPQETPNYTQQVEAALEQMDRLQAWDFEHKVKEVLGKLNIKDFQQLVGNMSGGQRRKVALARVLIDEVDFLILDEPTNHLDIDMIEWMEGFLSRQKMSMLVVTHDRYFLDNLCESIIEIDRQTIFHYKGTYDYYIEKKAERENALEQEVLKARNLYRKELEWIRRMPKARTTKSKARIDAFDVIGQKAAQKLEEERPEISVKARRLGKKILEINNLHHSFGDIKTVQDFTTPSNGAKRSVWWVLTAPGNPPLN